MSITKNIRNRVVGIFVDFNIVFIIITYINIIS